MTPLSARQAAFAYERQNPSAQPSVAFLQGYLYAQDKHEAQRPATEPVAELGDEITFETFWQQYDYKKAKPQALKMWKRLSRQQQQEVMQSLPAYIRSTPDKQFRMHPATYLNPNNERWKDEIIDNNEQQKTTPEQQRFAAYAQAISNVARKS